MDTAPLYFVEKSLVHRALRLARYDIGSLSYQEELDMWLLASLFMTKVFTECRRLGIFPQEPRVLTGDAIKNKDIDLVELMYEAEEQLGFTVSVRRKKPKHEAWLGRSAEYVAERRRRFAMGVFLRMTSGGIIR